MSSITRFSVRTSGRNLREVRRPKPAVDPTTLKKAELAALAEARGVDTSGTKADILARLTPPESNDADVWPADD